MDKCHKGWAYLEFNKEGHCCCNCKHQKKLMKHPCNEPQFSGSCATQCASDKGTPLFVCAVPDALDHAYLSTDEHGMCEMYTERLECNKEKNCEKPN